MTDYSTVKDYDSENVHLDYLSNLDSIEAEELIGKTISRVDGSEGSFAITFADGTQLRLEGWTYGECGMYIELFAPGEFQRLQFKIERTHYG